MRSFLRCACVFALFLLNVAVSVLSARELTISGARITTGAKSMSVLPRGAGAYLCFKLENAGDADEYVTVSIRSAGAAGEDAYFSAEFFAPAKSVQQCQFPFQLDGSGTYTISAGGAAEIANPELSVLPFSGTEYLNLTVTDEPVFTGFSSVNGYNKLKGFPGHCFVETASGADLPVAAHQLEHYRAILLYKTDFGKWYAKSFEAIAEYVKNGGTLCFGTPQDAYNATKTSLAELVPVKFFSTGLHRTDSKALLKTNERIPIYSVTTVPQKGSVKMDGMPGFAEKKVGKGFVRAASFDIWQSVETLAACNYGEKLGAFLAGTPIPERQITYTHTRLQGNRPFFAFPQERDLIAVLVVLFAGILLIYAVWFVLHLFLADKIRKSWTYAVILIWGIVILLLGCIRGGLLFNWIPLPGEAQQSVRHES